MDVRKSTFEDLRQIQEIYGNAIAYMKLKKQVAWPKFASKEILKEISEHKNFKILVHDEIACIWSVTYEDELIWGSEKEHDSLFIHRIASNKKFRGWGFVSHIVSWAKIHCKENKLQFIRMDTVGHNQRLIEYYIKCGFDFLGTKSLSSLVGLPEHYRKGDVCLFQIDLKYEYL